MKKIILFVAVLAISAISYAQIDRSKQPQPGSTPTINLKKAQSFVLPNGLTVMVVENHKLPTVSFSLLLDNPPVAEGEMRGLQSLTSSMMGDGTSRLNKDQYNQKLEYYGADVNFSLNGVDGSTLSKYFSVVFPLVAQGALDPLFTQDDMTSQRDKILEGLKADEKSAQAIATRVRGAILYGTDHPYGEVTTAGSIQKVTLNDIKNCYKTNFVPTKAYLVVVGDVTLPEVKKLAIANFSSWKKAPVPVSKYANPVNPAKSEIDIVDVPNAVQSEIAVTNLVNLKMTSPDYFAALLANQILGSTDSRLFNNLRERHGWTYGAYSQIGSDKYCEAAFTATTSVRNLVTDSSVVEIMHELDTIRTTLPKTTELELAKAKYIGSFVMNAEKPHMVARFALNEKIQNLPAGYYENYIKNINSVTLQQVQDAAEKYFSRDNTHIIIVGKASDFESGLENMDMPIHYFDKDGNEVAKPQEKVVDASVTPNAVLTKFVSAIGGEAALKGVKSIITNAKASIQGRELNFMNEQTADGKTKTEISMMGMTMMKSVFDGTKGYVEMQGNKKDMDAEEIKDAKVGLFPELDMLKSDDVKLAGIETIDGSDAYKLTEGNKTYFYDIKSGLKVAEESATMVKGQSMVQRVLMSDYQPVKGILFPFKITINMMGNDIVQQVSDVKINEGVADGDFK